MDGNKVNWSVACDQMTGAGEFVYSADTYRGTMRVKSQGKRNDDEVRRQATGRLHEVGGAAARVELPSLDGG